jgi:hypothetical protein
MVRARSRKFPNQNDGFLRLWSPYCSKTKLYRFDGDSGEWKERGIGQARLLQHKENKKVRMLMRQEKTLKIRANHLGKHAFIAEETSTIVCISEPR